MRYLRNIVRATVAIFLFSSLFSCSGADVGSFAWTTAQGNKVSFGQSASFPKGDENKFSAAYSENSYTLKSPLVVEPGYMLAVSLNLMAENLAITLGFGQNAKKPDKEVRFAAQPGHATFYLRAPDSRPLKNLNVSVKPLSGTIDGKDETALAEIESVALVPAFHGYERMNGGGYRISEGLAIARQGSGSSLWTIELPFSDALKLDGKKTLIPALRLRYATASGADIVAQAGVKVVIKAASAKKEALVPASVFPKAESAGAISLSVPDSVGLESAYIESVPAEEALRVDPGIVLLQPALAEGQDLAHYRWDLLPNVI
ncbi:MAG TPA: hypothetical protein VN437_07630, partial [Rectinemataceae bacterium]|nr:hypothetical protein [Rectinemataceae bacterium]